MANPRLVDLPEPTPLMIPMSAEHLLTCFRDGRLYTAGMTTQTMAIPDQALFANHPFGNELAPTSTKQQYDWAASLANTNELHDTVMRELPELSDKAAIVFPYLQGLGWDPLVGTYPDVFKEGDVLDNIPIGRLRTAVKKLDRDHHGVVVGLDTRSALLASRGGLELLADSEHPMHAVKIRGGVTLQYIAWVLPGGAYEADLLLKSGKFDQDFSYSADFGPRRIVKRAA